MYKLISKEMPNTRYFHTYNDAAQCAKDIGLKRFKIESVH